MLAEFVQDDIGRANSVVQAQGLEESVPYRQFA
jgi:hypothetical protein